MAGRCAADVFLHETVHLTDLAGGALVVGGVLLGATRRASRARTEEEKSPALAVPLAS